MRENILASLKRAVASQIDGREPDQTEHDSDGEQRLLAYKLAEDGSPTFWERGDRYPRPDEVDVTLAQPAPMPAPQPNYVRYRI